MDAWDRCVLTGAESNSALSPPIIPPSQSCFTEEIPSNLPFIKINPKLIQRQSKALTNLEFPDSFALVGPKLSKNEDKENVAGLREGASQKCALPSQNVVCLLNTYFKK